eukprot:Colp12_sorted_trinity150504_noHs@25091
MYVSILKTLSCGSRLRLGRRQQCKPILRPINRSNSTKSTVRNSRKISIVQLGNKGRGIVALEDIQDGETIFEEDPLIASPSVLNKFCMYCLSPLNTAVENEHRCYCDKDCKEKAKFKYGPMLEESSYLSFAKECEGEGRRFPVLAALMGAATLQEVRTSGSMQSSHDVYNQLVYASNTPTQSAVYQPDYTRVCHVAGLKDNSHFFSMEWYARAVSVCNLNSFRVMYGETVAGSALYAVGSMVNHSCEPTATPMFKNSAVLSLVAARDTKAGEEITISYTDVSRSDRRQFLEWNYGFVCGCRLCLEEVSNELT